MTHRIKVDAATLWEKRNVKVSVNIPGIYNFQVCCGGGGWPTPYEVGIYLDAANRQCCIIDWHRPRTPVRFSCEYGDFNEPNVICTEDTDDFEWPKNGEEATKLWVVVIDYHF